MIKLTTETRKAVFGGGCFWCLEAVFDQVKGVLSVVSGYSGGSKQTASYENVTTGDTGHAEVVKIEYDPDIITFHNLLEIFFHIHDPTTYNRQGSDIGPQYRSVIFYINEDQKEKAYEYIMKLKESSVYQDKIVTEIVPLEGFYPASKDQQDYYIRNRNQPYCRYVIDPKLKKFQKELKKYAK